MKDTFKKTKTRKIKATIKFEDGKFFLEEEGEVNPVTMKDLFEPFQDEFVEITINNKEESEGFDEE